jgi:Ca2+-binding EF-hand superfamily protein
MLSGILNPEDYHVNGTDIVMELLGQLYPTNQIGSKLRPGTGRCFVPVQVAMDAINLVFPPHKDVADAMEAERAKNQQGFGKNVGFKKVSVRMRLSEERRMQLQSHIQEKMVVDYDNLPKELRQRQHGGTKKDNQTNGKQQQGSQFNRGSQYIDTDNLLKLGYRFWKEQYIYNRDTLVEVFIKFDTDGDGVMGYVEFSKLMKHISGNNTHLSNRKLERMFREANNDYDMDDDSNTLSHEELRRLAEVCMSNGIVVDQDRDEVIDHLLGFIDDQLKEHAVEKIQKQFRGYGVRTMSHVFKWRRARRKLKTMRLMVKADALTSSIVQSLQMATDAPVIALQRVRTQRIAEKESTAARGELEPGEPPGS